MRRLLLSRCNFYGQRAVDRLVEYLWAFRTREQCALFCRVQLIGLDDADEVAYRIGFVLLDGIQDTREVLEDSVHVRVGKLSLDYDERVVRLHELCRYL